MSDKQITIEVNADTTTLVRQIKTITKHLEALVRELEKIEDEKEE